MPIFVLASTGFLTPSAAAPTSIPRLMLCSVPSESTASSRYAEPFSLISKPEIFIGLISFCAILNRPGPVIILNTS